MTAELVKYSGVAVMWSKMILTLLLLLALSAMVLWWLLGVSFDTFYSQVGLFFFALFMGLVAAFVGVRLRVQVR